MHTTQQARVGRLVRVAAALQYLSGLSIFYLPASPPSLRSRAPTSSGENARLRRWC